MKGSVPKARREGENHFGLFFVPCGAPFCGKLFLVPDSGIFSIQINWNLANSRSLRTSPQTGVAIPRIDAPLLVDEFQKTVQKSGMYDERQPEIRWRFPHQCAHWFGMTMLFDARSFLCKFHFLLAELNRYAH